MLHTTTLRKVLLTFLILAAMLVLPFPGRDVPVLRSNPLTSASTGATSAFAQAFGQLPLYFVENQGQMDKRVAYYVQGSDKTIYFTSKGVTFVLTTPSTQTAANSTAQMISLHPGAFRPERETSTERQRWVVKLDFVGANPDVRPVGEGKSEAVISYFKGPSDQWHAGLPTYSRIVYPDLWPGIDLVYYGTVNQLKYEFIVHPNADPAQIRLAYRGAECVTLNAAGHLEVITPVGSFADHTPVAYQDIDGKCFPVSVAYALQDIADHPSANQESTINSQQSYTFALGPYDPTHPLILDPAVLVYSGYIGGNGYDWGQAIAVDDAGNAYVTGYTTSTDVSFPLTGGPDLTYNGNDDAFVVKVNPAGSRLVYAGYIGGNDSDSGQGIAVDGAGNAYVTGYTSSTEASFPVTGGPDLTHNGSLDAFVAKINIGGTSLVYAGYIGGDSIDDGHSIAVDGAGNAYVTGYTSSTEASFPVTGGPDMTHNGGTYDAFVAKVNATGSGLVYAGYIGGNGRDAGHDIAVDNTGNAYITSWTHSTETTFPVTGGPDLTYNGGCDAFVAKVNAAGSGLVYCGYIGGNGEDLSFGIAVDGAGNAYVMGFTRSTEVTFPVTGGPDLTYNGGTYDAFVAKVNATGSDLVYAGYIGGNDRDLGRAIAVDSAGNAYVIGCTLSTEESFPVTSGPDMTHNGSLDAYVAKVNATGSGLVYAGYIGGNGGERGRDIAVDGAGNAYITGQTSSTEASFPVIGVLDSTYNGGYEDAFVAKVAPARFSISGRVADASSNPITGVLVLADAGLDATTNASGYYTLTTTLTGTYTLTPTLSGASFWPVTRTVMITSADVRGQDFTCVIPPTGVTITGPLTGTIGTVYTFTASVRPITMTMPITYTWTPAPNGRQGIVVATYTWLTGGAKTITVTAKNVGDIVSDTHVIAIEEPHRVYLPLVLRQSTL